MKLKDEKNRIFARNYLRLWPDFENFHRKLQDRPLGCQSLDHRKGVAINKKFLLITAVLFGLIVGGELLLPVFEEIGLLTFEWVEKTLDIFFEAVFDFAPESAQKATAWTGLFLIIGLLVWVGHTSYRKYLQAKAAAPQWWEEKKTELKTWWASLPWTHKLAYVLGYVGLVGILAMFI